MGLVRHLTRVEAEVWARLRAKVRVKLEMSLTELAKFRTHLSDGHGAEDVEEDEGAVCEVFSHEVAVGQTLQEGEGSEGKLCYHVTVEPADKTQAHML